MTHVAICFSDPSGVYYKHALVTGASLFANARGNLTLHVVHDATLRPEAEKQFLSLPRAEGQRVCFYNARTIPEDVERKVPESFSRGALFRLMLPDLIAEKKLLYLDCDVVCECDPFLMCVRIAVKIPPGKAARYSATPWRSRLFW